MNDTTFILFRHAETNTNVSNIIQGNTNNCFLTRNGMQQAFRLGKELLGCYNDFEFVLSGETDRASTTTEIMMQHFNLKEGDFFKIKDLNGIDKGTLTGCSLKEFVAYLQSIDSDFPRNQIILDDDLLKYISVSYPQGESRLEVVLRVIDTLLDFHCDKKLEIVNKNIAVCMHSSTMEPLKVLLGKPPSVKNTEFIEVGISKLLDLKSQAEKLVSLNCLAVEKFSR